MAGYTLKGLKELSTEELIVRLVINSWRTTKASNKDDEKILKILAERKIVDYDVIKNEYERRLWE